MQANAPQAEASSLPDITEPDLVAELDGDEERGSVEPAAAETQVDPAGADTQEGQRVEEPEGPEGASGAIGGETQMYDDDPTQEQDEDATQQSEEGPGSPRDAPRRTVHGGGASTSGSAGKKRRATVIDDEESEASSSGRLAPPTSLPPHADYSEDKDGGLLDRAGTSGDARGSSQSLPWKRKLTAEEKKTKQVVKPCDRGPKHECGGRGVCMCPKEHPHLGRCKLVKWNYEKSTAVQ